MHLGTVDVRTCIEVAKQPAQATLQAARRCRRETRSHVSRSHRRCRHVRKLADKGKQHCRRSPRNVMARQTRDACSTPPPARLPAVFGQIEPARRRPARGQRPPASRGSGLSPTMLSSGVTPSIRSRPSAPSRMSHPFCETRRPKKASVHLVAPII